MPRENNEKEDAKLSESPKSGVSAFERVRAIDLRTHERKKGAGNGPEHFRRICSRGIKARFEAFTEFARSARKYLSAARVNVYAAGN